MSFRSSPTFRAAIPVLDLAQIAVIVLLWLPEPTRAFFRQRHVAPPSHHATA